jgi:hypothetical protein
LLKRPFYFLHHMFLASLPKIRQVNLRGFISGSYIQIHCSSHAFYANNMLFFLLWLWSILWIWVLWYLLHCSFCSILPWLLVIFVLPGKLQGWYFNHCVECHWNFDGDCGEHVDCFW